MSFICTGYILDCKDRNPCRNGATCRELPQGALLTSCQCAFGWGGKTCKGALCLSGAQITYRNGWLNVHKSALDLIHQFNQSYVTNNTKNIDITDIRGQVVGSFSCP